MPPAIDRQKPEAQLASAIRSYCTTKIGLFWSRWGVVRKPITFGGFLYTPEFMDGKV
jgi:hypothetical protein